MTIQVFHQMGHFSKWNFESYRNDHVGDGFILGPSHMEKEKIDTLDESIKRISIFDPQFFLPNIQIRKLATYDFFPDRISDGFQTGDFHNGHCEECATRCINFQIDSEFDKLIIPTRYMNGLPTNFITQQNQLFVSPFLSAINNIGSDKPILLQLVINDNMIKNDEYAAELLNWITGLRDISGIYLIADINPRAKQLRDIDFLYKYLKFIQALRFNDLYVLLGYQNTEAILLSLADPNAITIGSYENLRMFNIRNFEPPEKSKIRGPNARIYCSHLTQWIDNNYIGAISRRIGNDIFDNNHYRAVMFQPTYKWHFTKPELYMHYFLVFNEQIKNIGNFEGESRYSYLLEVLSRSSENFNNLQHLGIMLDNVNDGSHIAPWITAANLYASDQGWRA